MFQLQRKIDLIFPKAKEMKNNTKNSPLNQ